MQKSGFGFVVVLKSKKRLLTNSRRPRTDFRGFNLKDVRPVALVMARKKIMARAKCRAAKASTNQNDAYKLMVKEQIVLRARGFERRKSLAYSPACRDRYRIIVTAVLRLWRMTGSTPIQREVNVAPTRSD